MNLAALSSHGYPTLRTLEVTVIDARGVTRDSEYTCHVYLDSDLYARTPPSRGSSEVNPAWSSHFIFHDVAKDIVELRLVLTSKLAAIVDWVLDSEKEWVLCLPLRDIFDGDGAPLEQWHQLGTSFINSGSDTRDEPADTGSCFRTNHPGDQSAASPCTRRYGCTADAVFED